MQRHAAPVPSCQTKLLVEEDPPSESIETSPLRSPTKKYAYRN